MKIHISEDCKKFLEKTGNYRIVPRGSVDIKVDTSMSNSGIFE